MHELALAEGIVDIVADIARRERFSQVRTVFVEMGRQSCVTADALIFCFDLVARGTLAEGAQLKIASSDGDSLRVRELEVA